MSIKTYIIDPESGLKAEVVNSDETNALVVATRPLKTYENSIRFFTNSDYGADLNQDASAGGTPDYIHDGIDNVYWTASDIIGGGKTTFDSTDQNHTGGGSQSVKVDDPPIGDVFQFAKGSDIVTSGYVSLSSWVYVDKDWTLGDDIQLYGYDTDLDLQVGNSVGLQNYFNYSTFDVWQKLNIPLDDMGIANETTLDAFRIRNVAKTGRSPKFYIDDIQLEQTGTPISYSLTPMKGTWLHVYNFKLSVVDAIASTLADATMPYLSYDKLLDVTLITGITYLREQDGEIKFSLQLKNLIELLQLSGIKLDGFGSDGTNTWITIIADNVEPIILKSENDDILKFILNDDMSGLLHFRISAGCKIEYR